MNKVANKEDVPCPLCLFLCQKCHFHENSGRKRGKKRGKKRTFNTFMAEKRGKKTYIQCFQGREKEEKSDI